MRSGLFLRKFSGTATIRQSVPFDGRCHSSQLEIKVNDNDVERALKALKREVQKDGLLGEIKKRRYYEKPSVKLRRKQREAEKRRLKSLRRKRRP